MRANFIYGPVVSRVTGVRSLRAEFGLRWLRTSASRSSLRNKKPYEKWWTEDKVAAGVTDGTVVCGQLHLPKNDPQRAWLRIPGANDVALRSFTARNRCLNGDIVAVELERAGDGTTDVRAAVASRAGRVVALLSSEAEAQGSGALKCQHVGVLSPTEGVASAAESSAAVPTDAPYVWFQPLDTRVPTMRIPRVEAPAEFIQNPGLYNERPKLWVCKMSRWREDQWRPFGRLKGLLGEAGDLGAETDALLRQHGIDGRDFPHAAMRCLRRFAQRRGAARGGAKGGGAFDWLATVHSWRIPRAELSRRTDFRDTRRVFTIDPADAKDLDDALHCRAVPANEVLGEDGTPLPAHYEVGVHIADVSYFVRANSALDAEAQRRATSVYLAGQRVVPMLPFELSGDLCSLRAHSDRLAFTCVFRMGGLERAAEGELGELLPNAVPWFGRSVVRSCAQLSYADAQLALDDHTGGSEARASAEAEALSTELRALRRVALARRRRRFGSAEGSQAPAAPPVEFSSWLHAN